MAARSSSVPEWDVLIVGGGPAGLSAALVLGRCRRRILLCDDGRPRNRPARRSHGFFTRDGTSPTELIQIGREQLRPYDVTLVERTVTSIEPDEDGAFLATVGGDEVHRVRRVLLATGLKDTLPPIDGVEPLYGKSVFHCPYCDGWEVQGRPLAAYGRGTDGVELALGLTTWSDDVALVTDGWRRFDAHQRLKLAQYGVKVFPQRMLKLVGNEDGQLERICFRDGTSLERHALFFHSGTYQRSPLPQQLGCAFNRRGCVKPGKLEETNVPGVYVAGDVSRDLQFVVIAAAEGAKAAVGINKSLREEDTARKLRDATPTIAGEEASLPG